MIANSVSGSAARDEFLTLLVTQLQHQDPLEPVPQQDFIAQLAQFSTLEGIEELNSNFGALLKVQQLTQGAELVGQTAVYLDPDSPSDLSRGVVEAVTIHDGTLYLDINKQSVPVDNVKGLTSGTPN